MLVKVNEPYVVVRINELCMVTRANELCVLVRVNELYVVVRVNELCVAVRVNELCVVVRVNELCMVASEIRPPHVSFVKDSSSRPYAFASFFFNVELPPFILSPVSFCVFFFQFSGEDILC